MNSDSACSLRIREGRASDWKLFRNYHYHKGGPAPVSRVWVAETDGGEPIGCVVYAFVGLGCGARRSALAPSLATGSIRDRAPRLNANLRVLHRLAVAPAWRRKGVATRLVAQTVASIGVPWVECISRQPDCLVAAGFRDHGPIPPSREARRLVRIAKSAGRQEALILTADACADARASGVERCGAANAFADDLIRAAGPPASAALLSFLRQFNESRRGHLRGRLRHGASDGAALAQLSAALASLAHQPHYCLWTACPRFQHRTTQ